MRIVAITGLVVLLATAGAGGPSARGAPAVQGVTNDSIRIGMHLPLSGPVAVFGRAYLRPTKIVFDRVNAAGGINGRKLDLIIEEDGGDPAKGVAAAIKLIDRDRVFLILGGPFTPVALAVFPEVVRRGLIYWSPAASTPLLTRPFNRLIFQAQMTLDDQAIPVAKLVASMKPKKIGFLRQNDEYGGITYGATIVQLRKYNLQIAVMETIEPTPLSAVAQVARFKQEGVDVVIYGGTVAALTQFIREAHKAALNVPIVSFGGGSAPAIEQLVSTEAPIEFYSITPLACGLEDPCAREFLEIFRKTFPGEQPLVWDAQGYAALQMFAEGLRRAGRNLSTDAVIKAFEEMPPFKSPLLPYPIKFSSTDHRGIRGGYLYGFRNGKLWFFGDELKR